MFPLDLKITIIGAMKKKSWLYLCTLPSLLFLSVLSSCSSSSSSLSRATSPYTIEYYDDSPEPVRIGYSYVIPGGNATTISHDEKYSDGSSWNFVSRSKAAFSRIGAYRSFDSWTAMDGGTVNLSSVTSDLKVKAKFVEKDYTFSANFYNDDNIKAADSSVSGLKWGDTPAFPTLASYQQVDYNHPTANTHGFWGYDFVNPSQSSLKNPAFSLKGDTSLAPIPSTWAFASGESKSDTVLAAGTLFVETALNDVYASNPTYPLYLSNGTSWLSLGKMSEGVSVSFMANYSKVLHSFAAKFYDKDPEANANASLLGEISVPFTKSFTCVVSSGTTTISYDTQSVSIDPSKTSPTATSWTGRFVNCDGTNYSGKTVDQYTMMADAVFFPA